MTTSPELNRIANQIDQNLRQAAPVAMPRRQFGGQIELKREFLVGRQRLKRAADRLGDVLNGIIGQFEHQLASFDDPGSYL
jgi:hypothetical protein